MAIIVGLYPAIYLFMERDFGILGSKSEALLSDIFWNSAFYTHIVLGGVALLIGWVQFSPNLLRSNPSLHRAFGKIYIISVLLSSLASIELGFFATGGVISSAGFIGLGVVWFASTLMAFIKIKNKQIDEHRKLMIYSYAACFAAVTLRIWLPILMLIFKDFDFSYRIVAWLCWIPNLLVAAFIVKNLKPYKISHDL